MVGEHLQIYLSLPASKLLGLNYLHEPAPGESYYDQISHVLAFVLWRRGLF